MAQARTPPLHRLWMPHCLLWGGKRAVSLWTTSSLAPVCSPARQSIACAASGATHTLGFWVAPGVESMRPVTESIAPEQTAPSTLIDLRLGYDYKPGRLGVCVAARTLTNKRYVVAVTVG